MCFLFKTYCFGVFGGWSAIPGFAVSVVCLVSCGPYVRNPLGDFFACECLMQPTLFQQVAQPRLNSEVGGWQGRRSAFGSSAILAIGSSYRLLCVI
eukprot:5497361-Amphidinium_carterae.1